MPSPSQTLAGSQQGATRVSSPSEPPAPPSGPTDSECTENSNAPGWGLPAEAAGRSGRPGRTPGGRLRAARGVPPGRDRTPRPPSPTPARSLRLQPPRPPRGPSQGGHSLAKSCWMRGKPLPGPPKRMLTRIQVRPTERTRTTMRRGPGAVQTRARPPQRPASARGTPGPPRAPSRLGSSDWRPGRWDLWLPRGREGPGLPAVGGGTPSPTPRLWARFSPAGAQGLAGRPAPGASRAPTGRQPLASCLGGPKRFESPHPVPLSPAEMGEVPPLRDQPVLPSAAASWTPGSPPCSGYFFVFYLRFF